MSDEEVVVKIHPEGERPTAGLAPPEGITSVDTFAGKIQMKWMPEAAVSSLGLMPFFIEFLKTSGRFDEWVEECPLQYTRQRCRTHKLRNVVEQLPRDQHAQ